MDEYESLSHTKWDCKYHVVFIPKCRRRTIYGELRPHLGEVFGKLAQQKESRIEEGHLLADHVHMLISIPPKHAVSQVVGFIKGKSAIHLTRVYGERKCNFVGQHFWARGYFVSTVGRAVTRDRYCGSAAPESLDSGQISRAAFRRNPPACSGAGAGVRGASAPTKRRARWDDRSAQSLCEIAQCERAATPAIAGPECIDIAGPRQLSRPKGPNPYRKPSTTRSEKRATFQCCFFVVQFIP